MAKDKQSFLLYGDIIYTIEHLTNEEKGRLFQHLLEYVNDLNPVLEDRLLLVAWKPIERQLKRDLKKYENKKEERSRSGLLGNLKRYNKDLYDKIKSNIISLDEALLIAEERKTSHSDNSDNSTSHSVAKLAVNDTVTVNDNVTVNDTVNEIIDKSITINNEKFKKDSLKDSQWLEVSAMQSKISIDAVKLYLGYFEDHLVTMEEQKNNTKDFKSHFTYWLKKQDLSQHRKKVIGRTNQI